jgi:hypothetical protein
MVVTSLEAASYETKKPAPKIPTIIGSTTVKAKAVATAASTALPPLANISAPAREAMGWFAEIIPPEAAASCLSHSKINPALLRQPFFALILRLSLQWQMRVNLEVIDAWGCGAGQTYSNILTPREWVV